MYIHCSQNQREPAKNKRNQKDITNVTCFHRNVYCRKDSFLKSDSQFFLVAEVAICLALKKNEEQIKIINNTNFLGIPVLETFENSSL
jgi:hypothetical protein